METKDIKTFLDERINNQVRCIKESYDERNISNYEILIDENLFTNENYLKPFIEKMFKAVYRYAEIDIFENNRTEQLSEQKLDKIYKESIEALLRDL